MGENMKKMLNESLKDYVLKDEDKEHLKRCILMILADVDFCCRKHHIDYSVAFGTLLGAVRHKGFIPWDDDIDIYMFREDFESLFDKLEEDFPKKYSLSIPGQVSHDPCRFGKIMLNGTKYVEMEYAGMPWDTKYWRGISIDVFLLDYVPSGKISRSFRAFGNLICCAAASSLRELRYPSPILLTKSKESKSLRRFLLKRRILGIFFCLFPIRFYVKLSRRFLMHKKKTSMVTDGETANSYFPSIIPTEWLLDTIDLDFENIKVRGFKQFDKYLIKFYGDWHKIPEVEDREIHILYSIDFGRY